MPFRRDDPDFAAEAPPPVSAPGDRPVPSRMIRRPPPPPSGGKPSAHANPQQRRPSWRGPDPRTAGARVPRQRLCPRVFAARLETQHAMCGAMRGRRSRCPPPRVTGWCGNCVSRPPSTAAAPAQGRWTPRLCRPAVPIAQGPAPPALAAGRCGLLQSPDLPTLRRPRIAIWTNRPSDRRLTSASVQCRAPCGPWPSGALRDQGWASRPRI